METVDGVERATVLVEDAEPRCGATTLVCIDGRSGSGKTEFAAGLSARLGAPALALDELLHGWDDLAEVAGRALVDVITPLRAGRPARFQRWDWAHDRLGPWQEVPVSPVLLLEGCGAGSGLLSADTSVLVWLEVDPALRRQRALVRDPGYLPFWDRWAAQEDSLYAAEHPWDRADLVVTEP